MHGSLLVPRKSRNRHLMAIDSYPTTMPRLTWPGDPMAPLLDDHAMARAVLDAMEHAARVARIDAPKATAFWQHVQSFFADWFDAVHHQKEERLLLPLLEAAGFAPPHSPVARMRQEHEQLRPFRDHLAKATAHGNPAELRSTVHAFVQLHRRHMALEESQVFPMARAVLGSVTQHDLRLALAALDHDDPHSQRGHARSLVGAILGCVGNDDEPMA